MRLPLIAADLAQAEACGPFSPNERQLATRLVAWAVDAVVPAQQFDRS